MKTVKTDLSYFRYLEQHPNFTGILDVVNWCKFWLRNGKKHREDGPAVIRVDGSYIHGSYILWYIDGEELTEEEFKTWQRSQKLEKFLNDDDENS